jgi:hypothetical protein
VSRKEKNDTGREDQGDKKFLDATMLSLPFLQQWWRNRT